MKPKALLFLPFLLLLAASVSTAQPSAELEKPQEVQEEELVERATPINFKAGDICWRGKVLRSRQVPLGRVAWLNFDSGKVGLTGLTISCIGEASRYCRTGMQGTFCAQEVLVGLKIQRFIIAFYIE